MSPQERAVVRLAKLPIRLALSVVDTPNAVLTRDLEESLSFGTRPGLTNFLLNTFNDRLQTEVNWKLNHPQLYYPLANKPEEAVVFELYDTHAQLATNFLATAGRTLPSSETSKHNAQLLTRLAINLIIQSENCYKPSTSTEIFEDKRLASITTRVAQTPLDPNTTKALVEVIKTCFNNKSPNIDQQGKPIHPLLKIKTGSRVDPETNKVKEVNLTLETAEYLLGLLTDLKFSRPPKEVVPLIQSLAFGIENWTRFAIKNPEKFALEVIRDMTNTHPFGSYIYTKTACGPDTQVSHTKSENRADDLGTLPENWMKNGNLTMGKQSPYPEYTTDTFTHFRPKQATPTRKLEPIGGETPTPLRINDRIASTAIRHFSKFHPGRWIENFSRFPWYSEKYKTMGGEVAYVDDRHRYQELANAQAEIVKKRVDQLKIIIDKSNSPDSKLTATHALACYLVDYQDDERGISHSLRSALDKHIAPLLAQIIINSQPNDAIWPMLQNTVPLMPFSSIDTMLQHMEQNMGTTQHCFNWAAFCYIAHGDIAQSGFNGIHVSDETRKAIFYSAQRVIFDKLPDQKSAGVNFVHPIMAFANPKQYPHFQESIEVASLNVHALAPRITQSWKEYVAYDLRGHDTNPPFTAEKIKPLLNLLPDPESVRELMQQLQKIKDPASELDSILPGLAQELNESRQSLIQALDILAPTDKIVDFDELQDFLNKESLNPQDIEDLQARIVAKIFDKPGDAAIIIALKESGLLPLLTKNQAIKAAKITALRGVVSSTAKNLSDSAMEAMLTKIETQLEPIKATLALQQTALDITKSIREGFSDIMKTQINLKLKYVNHLQNLVNSQHENTELQRVRKTVYNNCGKIRKELKCNISQLLPNLTLEELVEILNLPPEIQEILLQTNTTTT
ncbi:MAG: hypothetical protein HN623_10855 [Bdellovibrionales bacterium]|nr:hypothetical protein [Bdellovibrionales bacterium]